MRRLRLAGPDETVGASGTLSLVSLAEMLAFINEDSDSGANDARIQVLLDSTCYSAFSLMGGRFLKRPATAFDYVLTAPDDGDVLFLPQFPIGSITSVELGYMSANGTFTASDTVTSDYYYADNSTGRLYSSWPAGMHRVRVVWTGGYATVPADAKEAVMIWAAVKKQRAARARWDVKTLQSGGEGYSYIEEDLPKSAAAIFSKYNAGELVR